MAIVTGLGVERRLDGNGRLTLPQDFREAAGFAAGEKVQVMLADIDGLAAFIVTKQGEGNQEAGGLRVWKLGEEA